MSMTTWCRYPLLMLALALACTNNNSNKSTPPRAPQSYFVDTIIPNMTTDRQASIPAQALFYNLYRMRGRQLIFGHHNSNLEGIGWKMNGTSDVEQVAGRLPGMIGMDLREVIKWPHLFHLPYYHKVREAHRAGSLVTFSWHMDNPATRGNFFDKTPAVHKLIPGGDLHDYYKTVLDQVAEFFFSLRDDQGEYIPIIFRPFHEHNGHWFWWSHTHRQCVPRCSTARAQAAIDAEADQDFIKLWRFTVDYLRKRRGVHHLLIAYAPGISVERDYFWRWPGNDYVDVMALDKYVPSVSELSTTLRRIVTEAEKRNKLAALAETGLEGITNPNYWTREFLAPMKNDPVIKKLSYAMVWRNASDRAGHYFAPYHGHPSVPDFLAMIRDPYVLMAGEQIKSLFIIHP